MRWLTGFNPTQAKLSLLDITQSTEQIINLVARYPGLLELLPFAPDDPDFTDTTRWRALSGTPGTTYEWMGEDGTSVDLSTGTRAASGATETYADLGWWKPVAATNIVPAGTVIFG